MLYFILFLMISFTPAASAGQDTDRSQAEHEFQKGQEAFAKGEFEQSLVNLEAALRSYEAEGDKKRIADTLYLMGRTYRRLARFPEALQSLGRAQQLHVEIEDQQGAGFDLTETAIAHQRQGNYDEAFQLSGKALAIHEATGNQEGIARTLDNFGNIQYRRGEYNNAIEYFERALSVATESGNKEIISIVLTNVGQVYYRLTNYQHALELYERAQVLAEERNDWMLLGAIVGNRAAIYHDQGDLTMSLKDHERCTDIFRQTGNQSLEATSYLNRGMVQFELGNYGKAQDAFQKALAMADALHDQGLEGTVLDKLGALQLEIGNYEIALDYTQRSLKISEEIGEKLSAAFALITLGAIREKQAKYPAALEFYQKAFQIFQGMDDKRGVALSLHSEGVIYSKMGNYKVALENYDQALEIRKLIGDKPGIAASYLMTGSVYYKQRDWIKADAALTESIEILQEVGQSDLLWPALQQKGLLQRDSGNAVEAIQWLRQAVEVIERVREEVPLAEQKSAYLENKLDVYEDLVNLLIQSQQMAEAFEYVQRSKARSFLDVLSEARLDPQASLVPELYQSKKRLQAELNRTNTNIKEEYEKDQPDAAAIRKLEQIRSRKEEEYANLLLEIRKQNPRYAELQYPRTVQLAEAQKLLDGDSALLDFFVGKRKSTLFLITSTDFRVFDLPGEDKLNGQIQEFLDVIQKPDLIWETSESARSRYVNLATILYKELVGPVEATLKGKQRIIIAPDGQLSYLPYEALLTRKIVPGEIDFSNLPYLAMNYEVRYVPSISVLAALTQNEEMVNKADQRELIAFADPLGGTRNVKAASDGAFREWSTSLPELPYARVEVEEISTLFSKEEVSVLIGKDASEQNVKKMDLEQYRIVHFASHGLIDEDRPQFSALLLSTGDSEEDGYLTMREIFDLRLRADLVVLSACKTGRGQQVRGEGVAGLSRAFFCAGSSGVLVSLWNVYDRSTANFMTSFYRSLKQNPTSSSAALRQARLKMIRDKKYSHPYYWAPFILIGTP